MDTAHLLWSLLFGSIGFGYFIYGKRQSNSVIRYSGIALMVYPYFMSNTIAIVVVGVILLFLFRFVSL
jgi:hypothetical protein